MPSPLLKHRNRLDLVKVIQRLQLHVLSQENIPLDPVRQEGIELIASVSRGGDGKDVVELFERSLFRFYNPIGLPSVSFSFEQRKKVTWEEEEDHDEGDDVQAGIESKGYVFKKKWVH